MLSLLKSGSFVTVRRLRAYSVMLLAGYALAIGALLASADGIVDAWGRPLGTDFANVYAAGRMAQEGNAALAYDWPAHRAVQQAVSGRADIPYYGWHYPPVFLFLATVLALFPYLAALFLYQALSLAAYVHVVRRIAGHAQAYLLALAFPAVFINVTHGHNGFVTAALLGGALLVLDRRPAIAGMLIGFLVYKPQFGVLIPLVLVATARWRTFAAAVTTVAVLCALTWLAFGTDVWIAFWRSLPLTQKIILEDGSTGFYKIQSVFAALRLMSAPVGIAYAGQLATMGTVAVTLVLLWRSSAAFPLKAAALLIGSLLATPYALDYDLVLLAPAIAFLAAHGLREGFTPYEVSGLVALWALPLAARTIGAATLVPLAAPAMLAMFFSILRRAGTIDTLAAWRGPAAVLARLRP
jgi:alpha-1,2-mannosyltransferase